MCWNEIENSHSQAKLMERNLLSGKHNFDDNDFDLVDDVSSPVRKYPLQRRQTKDGIPTRRNSTFHFSERMHQTSSRETNNTFALN